MRVSGALKAVSAVVLLVVCLTMVTWRQSRALEALADLDLLRREISILTAERNELVSRIQVLESRSRVVTAARDRLGMRTPDGAEIVWLADESDPTRIRGAR